MEKLTPENKENELIAFEKQVEENAKEFNEKLKRDLPRISKEIEAEIEKIIEGPTFKEFIAGLWKKIRRK